VTEKNYTTTIAVFQQGFLFYYIIFKRLPRGGDSNIKRAVADMDKGATITIAAMMENMSMYFLFI
jgi:hypothetical protein